MTKLKLIIAMTALWALFSTGAPSSAEAASASLTPLTPMAAISPGTRSINDLVEKVTYYGGFCYRHPYHWRCRHYRQGYYGGSYCRRWRWRCADRWGWQTRRYYRCLWRHGC